MVCIKACDRSTRSAWASSVRTPPSQFVCRVERHIEDRRGIPEMQCAGGRHGAWQPVGSSVFQPMTGGARYGVATREAHIME